MHSPYGCINHNGNLYANDIHLNKIKNFREDNQGIKAFDLKNIVNLAESFVYRYLREEILEDIYDIILSGSQPIYVISPVKPSYPRGNILAYTFAAVLARELDVKIGKGIYQAPRSFKRDKKKDFFERLAHPVNFFDEAQGEGEGIIPGANYIIADDVLTYGGTLAGLHTHVTQYGGHVLGCTTLAGNRSDANHSECRRHNQRFREFERSKKKGWMESCYKDGVLGQPPGVFPLAITQGSKQELLSRAYEGLAQCLQEELGFGVESLTEREAQRILKEFHDYEIQFQRRPESRQKSSFTRKDAVDIFRERIIRAKGA
ncbi:phosphoribosyltransferase [Formicincola oecophyllae]|uniref:phosphoribosyltransferase n=1 Tax=Formicincola oecophyllae TaxID=2558361 RepID=UPI00143D7036|nr:phosphoribosyltransferase [Formicincola oecophyllae]